MWELKIIEIDNVNAGLGPLAAAFVSGMGVGAIKMIVDELNAWLNGKKNQENKDLDNFVNCHDACTMAGKLSSADETLDGHCSETCGFKFPIGISYEF